MRRRQLPALLALLVLLELSLAALPHVHHQEAVRVGEVEHTHGGDDRWLVPALELLPASVCLACASHLPPVATAVLEIAPAGLRQLAAVDAREPPLACAAPAAVRRSRAPPAVAT